MDVYRPTLFIITEIIDFRSGIKALKLVREHHKGRDRPILVLSQNERPSEKAVAMSAGATAYARFPDGLDDYPALAESIRSLLLERESSRGRAGA
jgi:CheY-like chemotaxis protein